MIRALMALLLALPCLAGELPRVAFHYGPRPPLDELRAYDLVVLQPYAEGELPRGETRFLAYIGLGEWQGPLEKLPQECRLGENPVWRSAVLELRKGACRELLFSSFLLPAWERGFRGFFFDTLDSYRLVLPQTEWPAYQQAEVAFLREVRARFPEATILINRGFELLDRLEGVVAGVVAESLYRGFDPRRGYFQVEEADRRWLRERLQEARARGLVAISLEYLPPEEREQARRLARKIAEEGIVPYIADGHLQRLGVGLVEVVPRKLLLIHDGDPKRPNRTPLHRLWSPIVNYLGYSARPVPISQLESFPAFNGAYAGAILWLEKETPEALERARRWLGEARRHRLPILIFQASQKQLEAFAEALDLEVGPWSPELKRPLQILKREPHFGFEAPLPRDPENFYPLRARGGETWLLLRRGEELQLAAARTPWGGYVVEPYGIFTLGEIDLWTVDPFWLLKEALRLPELPVPDLTTLTGRRALFIHIDGDSFLSRSLATGHREQLAGEVCLEEIFRRYPLPHSVSFIGAELEGRVNCARGRLAEAHRIARQILALPWIEPATHTYSHPFEWAALEAHPERLGQRAEDVYVGFYSLAIEGYHRFDPYVEIVRSAEIVDRLAPPGKRTRLVFWSGDTDPGPESLRVAYRHAMLNINGDPTTIRRRTPSLTRVAGNGVWKGGFFQVYPAFGNDNDFTEKWTRKYGYRSVISSFRLTEQGGRRLKPLNIYYHFYSCELDAGLKNLHEIYRAALSWNPHPIFTSTYIQMALAFEHLALARRLDGGLEITGYGPATTLRSPKALGYPDLESSQNVAGFRDTPFGRYLHLVAGAERAVLAFRDAPPKRPYLIEANGQVVRYGRDALALRSEAGLPLEATLSLPEGCRLLEPVRGRGSVLLKLKQDRTVVRWRCRE